MSAVRMDASISAPMRGYLLAAGVANYPCGRRREGQILLWLDSGFDVAGELAVFGLDCPPRGRLEGAHNSFIPIRFTPTSRRYSS